MTPEALLGYVVSAAIGGIISFAISSLLVRDRLTKVETRLDMIDKHVAALLHGVGGILQEELLEAARRRGR